MTAAFELGQDAIEELEFSACSPQEIIADIIWIHRIFHFFEHERMIADFLQLHHRVIQSAESFTTQLAEHME